MPHLERGGNCHPDLKSSVDDLSNNSDITHVFTFFSNYLSSLSRLKRTAILVPKEFKRSGKVVHKRLAFAIAMPMLGKYLSSKTFLLIFLLAEPVWFSRCLEYRFDRSSPLDFAIDASFHPQYKYSRHRRNEEEATIRNTDSKE